jgi:hypothetical protein
LHVFFNALNPSLSWSSSNSHTYGFHSNTLYPFTSRDLAKPVASVTVNTDMNMK